MITKSSIPSGLLEQINSTLGKPKEEKTLAGDKARLNLKIPKEIKDDWEKLSKEHGLSITRLLMCSMEVLKEQLKSGDVELTPIGFKIKNY